MNTTDTWFLTENLDKAAMWNIIQKKSERSELTVKISSCSTALFEAAKEV